MVLSFVPALWRSTCQACPATVAAAAVWHMPMMGQLSRDHVLSSVSELTASGFVSARHTHVYSSTVSKHCLSTMISICIPEPWLQQLLQHSCLVQQACPVHSKARDYAGFVWRPDVAPLQPQHMDRQGLLLRRRGLPTPRWTRGRQSNIVDSSS